MPIKASVDFLVSYKVFLFYANYL